MASRQNSILAENFGTTFGSGSKQELGSPVRSKNSSVNGLQLKRGRPGMYRDNMDDLPDDEGSNGQQFGVNPSSLLFGSTSEKDLNSMYPASQAATSGYYGLAGLGGSYNSNGSLSSASVHNTVSATNTGTLGSRGTQFAGTTSRSGHTSNSASMPSNPLSTQSTVSSITGNGLSSRSILSPSGNGMGQQSQFSFQTSSGSSSSALPMTSQPPKLSRSMSATVTTQSSSSSGFSNQMRLTQHNASSSSTPSSGFENRGFVTQQSQPNSLESQQIDMSEFPTVGRANGRRPQSQASATSGLASGTAPPLPPRNYGIVSKPREQEFTMVSEDFPALPSSGSFKPGMSESGDSKLSQSMFPMNISSSSGFGNMSLSSSVGGDSFRITGSVPLDSSHQDSHPRPSNVGVIGQRPSKGSVYHSGEISGQSAAPTPSGFQSRTGIQTTADGVITNVPVGMVKDQFGLIGLLTFIRVAENEPNLVSLALGSDLTTLGLNLTSPDTLCSSFTSPFSDGPTRPQDIDFSVPDEYNTNNMIRDKLAPIKLHRYGEDLLFYLYYHSSGDLLQLAAAAELYQRDWRYHKEQHVWLTRATGMDTPLTVKNTLFETGRYYVFDVNQWRKAVHDMHIEYDQLEDTPHLPKSYQLQQHQGGGGGGSHHGAPGLSQLMG